MSGILESVARGVAAFTVHGCVRRLHPSYAAALFALVQWQGPRNTRIEISN
jgi:hypothetical protein